MTNWERRKQYARERFVSIRNALRKADSAKLVMEIMLVNNADLQMIQLISEKGHKELTDLADARQQELSQ